MLYSGLKFTSFCSAPPFPGSPEKCGPLGWGKERAPHLPLPLNWRSIAIITILWYTLISKYFLFVSPKYLHPIKSHDLLGTPLFIQRYIRMRKTKLAALCTLITLVMSLCFTACQPTPEEEIVKNKSTNNKILSEVSSIGDLEVSSTDNAWKETVKSKDTVININAEINSLNILQASQIQVEPAGFTVDQFKNFKESLLGDKELFQYQDSNILSKSDIEAKIVKARQRINAGQAGGYYYRDPVTGEETTLGAYEYIDKLMEDYDIAPATKTKLAVPMEFTEDSKDGERIYGLSESDNGNIASLCAYNFNDLKNNLMYLYSNEDRLEYGIISELEGEKINGAALTKGEAIEIANNFISKIKKDNEEFAFQKAYVASYIEEGMDASFDIIYSDNTSEVDMYDNTKQCFVLYYTKKYNDIDTNYVKYYFYPIIDGGVEESYQRIYEDQYIELYINDDGIFQVQWDAPDEVTGENEVKMLSLEKIKDIALKQIPLMNWSPDGKDIVINITSIEIGVMRIATKNDPDIFQVVPVWDFMGYIEGNQLSNFNQSMLTINAIDGTVINRALKY